ncbi:hypothetical protein HZB60_00340 [candidate division KSB1 bacterium]|nr:hypothetical protein [candidate division KSB1 bacterium]
MKTRPGVKSHGVPGEKPKAKAAPRFQVPFTRKNYLWLGIGLAVLLVGYVCLAQPPADGFLSLTLAPILLTTAYVVIFPYAIMAHERTVDAGAGQPKGD